MTSRNYLPLAVLFVYFGSSVSITNNSTKNYTEILWKLSNLALQGRQNYPNVPYPYDSVYPEKYHQSYNPYKYDYPQNYHQSYNPYKYGYPQKYYPGYLPPKPLKYQYYQPSPTPNKQSIMDALFSIAQNDDLQCVPKLVCELTSGAMSSRQQGINLPVNINSETLLAFISGLNSAQSSPVLHFGKAAVLGLAAKGNTGSCSSFYSRCPSDPEKLIQYLNNHNGGFFRFFQGLGQQENYYRPQYSAEKRILNHNSDDINTNNLYHDNPDDFNNIHSEIKFPEHDSEYSEQPKLIFPNYHEHDNRDGKTLQFPDHRDRKAKKLNHKVISFESNGNYLDIQKPLPNHIPDPNIFPDRTGTGELKLDFDDRDQYYNNDGHNFIFPN